MIVAHQPHTGFIKSSATLCVALACLHSGLFTVYAQGPAEQAREHFQEGVEAYKANNLDLAEEKFRTALKIRPNTWKPGKI